jgi:hypothetical protein
LQAYQICYLQGLLVKKRFGMFNRAGRLIYLLNFIGREQIDRYVHFIANKMIPEKQVAPFLPRTQEGKRKDSI